MKALAIKIGAVALALCAQASAFDRVEFLTEYRFEQDLRTFFNHKNDDFRETYLMAARTEFEMELAAYDSAFYFGLRYDNYLGMGRQNEAIVFDPRDVDYALAPFFEYRRANVFYQAGLDHRCFHQVDRMTRPTAYWNQVYAAASSANYRQRRAKGDYGGGGRGGFLDRLTWSARAGYFVRKFGGADATLLSGGHPWSASARIDAAYPFYAVKSWQFSARGRIDMLADTAGAPYWAGAFGIDADARVRGHAVGFFINRNREFPRALPLFSKDRLFELGIRFRY